MYPESRQFSLSALGGGEGRGEVGGAPARNGGATHLTLPVVQATGPLPLPPQAGGGGEISPTRRRILLAAAGIGLASFAPAASATEEALAEAIRDLIGE